VSEQSYSSVSQPPQASPLPQNPYPITWEGFTGLNTKASQQGIADQEMYICDGLMPLGPNNLRVLPDLGTAIYTAPGGRTIKSYGFGNIGATPICIVSLDDGSLVQVNMTTLATTTIGAAGTITSFNAGFSQWAGQYSIIVAPQTNGYFLWNGTSLFKAGTVSPTVTLINSGSGYTSAPTVTLQTGTAATGYISFAGNPSPGDTITLNGVVWTFVASGAVGPQFNIGGTLGFTIVFNVVPVLNASTDPAINAASYSSSGAGPILLTITYLSGGTIGNAYTLAASVATPSAGTLTGGAGGSGQGATFTASVANGSVTGISVSNPGHNFAITDLPIITITGGGSDDQASATPTVSTASGVASIIVNNGGNGYSSLVQVTASSAGASVPASFSVVGQNGVITQVIVQNPGLGYTSVPTLTITDLASAAVGTGASLTAVMQAGQISAVTVDTHGTGYTSPPTLTVFGDGTGASLQANLSNNSTVKSISVVNAGTAYTRASIFFNGGNRAASAVVGLMPFGVSGTTAETYQSRVWVGNGRIGQFSAPGGDPADFSSSAGAGAFQSNDSFLKVAYQRFIQSNGFLYLFGDSSLNYISGVSTSGAPAITTFNNLNVDPQIGSPWPGTVQAFGRDIVFANPIGVYVSYGGAVTKVSDALDGIFATVPSTSWPAGFTPTACVMTIFGIQVYILLLPILDQISGAQVTKCLMWDGKKWWTSPQTGITGGFCASQEINSVLTGYISPDGTTIKPMFTTPSHVSTMTKYLESKLWDAPGVFMTKMIRQFYVLINVNALSIGTKAAGTITFVGNPSDLDTVTLNGVVWTFVAGAAGANQTHIQSTRDATILQLASDVTASVNAALTVATYALQSAGVFGITYGTVGTAGNAYTLAASVATPSGVHLTGGTDIEVIYIAPVTEAGLGSETALTPTATGPAIFGPVPVAQPGKLVGVRLRTVTQDIQINKITPFTQIQQSNV
jgi:hypothetical protein